MAEEVSLNVMLAKRSDWRKPVSEVLAASSPAGSLASAILSSLHDRHVGVTPQLALDLATCLLGADPAAYPEPWRSVQARLQETLLDLAGVSRHEAKGLPAGTFRLRLGASFSFTVFQIALPLVEEACRHIGASILFTEDDDVVAVPWAGYKGYVGRLSAMVKALAASNSNIPPPLFWQERALVLDGLARTRQKPRSRDENLVRPAIDPPDLGLLLRLDPGMDDKQEFPRRDLLPYRQPDLFARRLPDAGTDGVHITHRLEDIHRRVLTEWLYPEMIQLDHLLNEGFLATRRPPQPVRLRDILIVGILPGELHRTGAGRLIKACWSDFVLRLGPLLQRSGLDRSELRWIEGDEVGRFLTWSLLVDELPAGLSVTVGREKQRQRQRARIIGGWLHQYLDSHAFFQAADGRVSAACQDTNQTPTLEEWLRQTWRSQKDNQAWHKRERANRGKSALAAQLSRQRFSDHPLDTAQYAYTHIMLFLPSDQTAAKGLEGKIRNSYWRRLFSLRSQLNSLSLTTAPNQVMAAHKWRFSGSFQADRPVLDHEKVVQVSQLAGELMTRWLRNIIEDLRHG